MSRGFVASNVRQHFADVSEQAAIDRLPRRPRDLEFRRRLDELAPSFRQPERVHLSREVETWTRRLSRISVALLEEGADMATALTGGRLHREDDLVLEFAENLNVELRDMQDYVEHIDAIEQAALENVAEAEARLQQAHAKLAAIRHETRRIKRHLHADRQAVLDFQAKAGFGRHLRPEVVAAADGAVLELAARRNGR